MGNTSSAKRHNSGDDTGPTMTASRLLDTSMEDGDFDPSLFKLSRGSREITDPYQRPRANTVSYTPQVTEKKLPTVFRWEGAAKEVYLSGSFNNWKAKIQLAKRYRHTLLNAKNITVLRGRNQLSVILNAVGSVAAWVVYESITEMEILVSDERQTDRQRMKQDSKAGNGDFFTILDLAEGEHQYKFYVDGQWVHDPNEPTVANAMGTFNNLMVVKKSDFEVFEALAIDSESTNSKRKNDLTGSPPGDYGQEIPPRRVEKVCGPPFLPPHLLQVILNKDTPAHCEPTLLPEPNHVMLNHLYALSIKDGVMVLSATHRFRKKYVTTLLYKPI